MPPRGVRQQLAHFDVFELLETVVPLADREQDLRLLQDHHLVGLRCEARRRFV